MFRQHTSVVRRETGFDSRTDLSKQWACMPMEATDPCKIGVIGSTPIRSTDIRKVAGYGLPGRTANACHQTGDEGSTPLPSACGSMVKWKSSLVSTEVFRVRILVGVLLEL